MGLSASKRPVVLIVEDELRMDAAEMIEAAGFEVVEAGNADQAVEILESRPDITVVFTDVQMPGSMDGLKLARAGRGRSAAGQDYRNLRPPQCGRAGSARRRAVSAQAL